MARKPVHTPAKYSPRIIYALKALNEGKANEGQQRQVLAWLIDEVCAYHDEPYRSDAEGGERATSYALGRRSVGREIMKLINFSNKALDALRRKEEENG